MWFILLLKKEGTELTNENSLFANKLFNWNFLKDFSLYQEISKLISAWNLFFKNRAKAYWNNWLPKPPLILIVLKSLQINED